MGKTVRESASFPGFLHYFRLSQKILGARNEEFKFLKKMKTIDAFNVYFWATTPLLVSFVSFTVHYFRGEPLTPSNVFTSIALFNMLLVPVNAYPWVINGFRKLFYPWRFLLKLHIFLVDVSSSIKRLNRFLRAEEKSPVHISSANGSSNDMLVLKDVHLDSDSFTAQNISTESAVILEQINLTLKQSEFAVISGRVGSGKCKFL